MAAASRRTMMLDHVFMAHPRALGETYLQHQAIAFRISRNLFAASLTAAVHGLLPCFFQTSASRTIVSLHGCIVSRSRPAGKAAD